MTKSPVTVNDDDSYLSNILILEDCVVKRLTLEIVLMYGSARYLCRYGSARYLCSYGRLSESGNQMFLPFCGTLGVFQIRDSKTGAFGKNKWFEFCGRTCSEV